MRLSRTLIAAAVLVTAALALPSLAEQDTPSDIGGINTVCTGVGSGKDDPRWSGYPVKLVLATPGGKDLAGAHVVLSQAGKTLVDTDCDAPWILFSPEPGEYTVTATMLDADGKPSGAPRSSNITVGRTQKVVTLTFARQTAEQ